MLVAFRTMTLEALRRLHALRGGVPSRHLPRLLGPGAVMVRMRVAHRRPRRAAAHGVEPRHSGHTRPTHWEPKRAQGGKHV